MHAHFGQVSDLSALPCPALPWAMCVVGRALCSFVLLSCFIGFIYTTELLLLEETHHSPLVFSFFLLLLQFLAHDTDFSSPLPRFEFDGQLNDVWLPISVPKVCV